MSNKFLRKSDFSSASKAVLCFEPAAFLVNKGAEKLWNNYRITARFVSAFQYLTNPLDRTLQALVTPFFATISYIYVTHDTFSKKDKGRLGYLGCQALKLVPCVAAKTICIWIPLVVNGVIHLIPFKVVSACKDDRPENFFKRRKYVRSSDVLSIPYYTPVSLIVIKRHLASVLRSDKEIVKKFHRHLIEKPFTHFDIKSPSYEKRVLKFDASPTERENVALLSEELCPATPDILAFFANEADRGIVREDRALFREKVSRVVGNSDVTRSLVAADRCMNIPSMFFLPVDFDSWSKDQQEEELRWRFGFYLKALDALKVSNSLRYAEYPETKERADFAHLRLSALVIHSYEKFVPRYNGTKSAAKI